MVAPSKLGRYELRQVLGKGAMGVVYDGHDPIINRRVAIKIILKSHAIDEETARAYSARFLREAQAAGRLSHPNIVQVYDFGEQEDIAYLVMEFVEGRELRSFFAAKEPFDIRESVRIMGELLDALDFAHEARVIHRDVKPANVMLDAQRRVKLADFGVARIQDSQRSAADTMVGTPAYMSPEQISGQKVDRRTDIFSAGSILYQFLTGEPPFKGEGAWTVAKQIMQDDPPLPSRVTVWVSPVFDEIVRKALAKDPAQRFANARAFADALRGAVNGRVQARPAGSSPAPSAPKQEIKPELKTSEAEIEFWRSIQNSNDLAELEAYLVEFPEGTYAQLARLKIAKLREATGATRKEAEERTLRERLNNTKREAVFRAQSEVDKDTAVPIGQSPALPSGASVRGRKSLAVPVIVATVMLAGGVAAYMMLGRTPAPAPVVIAPPVPVQPTPPVAEKPVPPVTETPAPAALKAEVATIDRATQERIRVETADRIRREYADKAAAEKVAAEKVAAEKAAAEKAAAEKAAAEKAAAEKAAAEKAAAEKAAAEKLAAAQAAAQREAAAKTAIASAAAPLPWQMVGPQSWVYRSYVDGGLRREFLGYITIEGRGGKTIFRVTMMGTSRSPCDNTDEDATVSKTRETTIITVVPGLRGCDEVRFVIKNDGTGGKREIKRGAEWVWDGLDHGLTPRR